MHYLAEIVHDILLYFFVICKAKLDDNFRNTQLKHKRNEIIETRHSNYHQYHFL